MKKMTTSAVPLGVVLLLVIGALARDSREDRSPGVTATNRGAVTSASIDFFERRLREHPSSFTTANALVDRYLLRFQEQGRPLDLRRAEEVARRVKALMSWDAGPHARLSAILLRQHRVLEAEREARIAARMDGKRADPVLFDALLERGLYDEVEAVLGRMDPRTFAYNVRYARLQEMMGNLDGSALAMSRACRTLSGAGVAGAMMAWCYTEQSGIEWSAGNLRRSRDLLERALAADPGYPGALEHLAWQAYRRGDLRRARELYEDVLAATGHSDVHLQLARIAERRGDDVTAEHHLREFESAATRPDLLPLYARYLALYYANDPQTRDRAVELALSDLEARPTTESYATLSWTLYQAGRVEEAVEASKKALSWGRPEATALYHAGMISLAAGEPAAASSLLRRALARRQQLDPADEAAIGDALEWLTAKEIEVAGQADEFAAGS